MPSEPRWLTAVHAVEFNRLAVEVTGEPFQLRDMGLLESALVSPINRWHHGETRVSVLAAYLLLAVARNHPFAQGNKRVALLIADAFLTINGYRLHHPDEGLADLILGALTRDVPEDEFVRRFAQAVVRPRAARVYRGAKVYRHARSTASGSNMTKPKS